MADPAEMSVGDDESPVGEGDLVGQRLAALEAAGEFASIDPDAIESEEVLAARRSAAIEAGRRKGGLAGAAMAGAMVALGEIYDGPPKEDAPIEIEAPGEPGDIDEDGIDVTVGEVDVWAPPPADRDDPPNNGLRV